MCYYSIIEILGLTLVTIKGLRGNSRKALVEILVLIFYAKGNNYNKKTGVPNMKFERDKYIKELMEKYNIYDRKELNNVLTVEEYNKLIELELRVVRGA